MTAPKIDTQAPDTIWDNGLGCYGHEDFGGTPYILASLSAAREAAAWIAGRDAAIPFTSRPQRTMALTPPDDLAAALDRLIAERVRDAVEAEREAGISVRQELYYCRSCGVRFLERDGHCDEDCAEGHANWNLATGEIKIDFIRARGSKDGQS